MIAIIPARGGSKGLPGKNIKPLNGIPLIAYTIKAALSATKIDRVVVSTDSEEIAKIAVEYGAECPFMRPENLATDTARASEVYRYTIAKLEELEGVEIKDIVILQPTSPLRTSLDIDNAISLFEIKNADSVVSYCEEQHPIIWHKYIRDDGRFEDIFDDKLNNRQEERPTYFPNGSIYIFKRDIIEQDIYYTINSYAYIMERKNSIDIDNIDDFLYAEYLLVESK